MRYIRVHNDENGEARFESCDLAFAKADFAPPAPPLDVSQARPVHELLFIRFSAGWRGSAHPAPARQWMLILSGRGDISAGGETLSWAAGDVLLLEDTKPPGHVTSVFDDAVFAVARL